MGYYVKYNTIHPSNTSTITVGAYNCEGFLSAFTYIEGRLLPLCDILGPILQRWGRPHFWSGDVRRPHFSGPMGTEVGGACLQVAPPAGGPQQHQPEWDRVVTKAPWRCEP